MQTIEKPKLKQAGVWHSVQKCQIRNVALLRFGMGANQRLKLRITSKIITKAITAESTVNAQLLSTSLRYTIIPKVTSPVLAVPALQAFLQSLSYSAQQLYLPH
jgi:hypothetical protein